MEIIKAVTSDGKSSESMATKETCIFVANDDLTCCNIVSEMLQRCTHEVLYKGDRTDDALNAIWERRDKLGVILTNVHSSNVKNILQAIQDEFNLITLLTAPNDGKVVLEGHGSSFTVHIVKFLDANDVKNLWQLSAISIEKAKRIESRLEEGTQKAPSTAEASTRNTPTNDDQATQVHYNPKSKAIEKNEDNEDGLKKKKPRVNWTQEMHQKFVKAIEILGYEKAFPTKILKVMNMPSLTRENVASHLQKYRMSLRRTQECSLDSTYGMNLPNGTINKPYFSSDRSPFHFISSSQGYSHLTRSLYGTQFSPGLSRVIPRSAPRNSFHSDTDISTHRSNLIPGQNQFSSQGNMRPLCAVDGSFSSTIPLGSNRINVGNSQCNDQNDLMQYQSSYAPKILLNSNFRLYNDHRKNVLLSITSNSSVDSVPATTSAPEANFLGLRLTRDGIIGPGKTGCLSNTEIRRSEILVPNHIQPQPTPRPTTVGNESRSQCPSTPASCLLEKQLPSLPSLENYSEENLAQLPSLPSNEECEQESPFTPLWIPENQYADHYSTTYVSNNPQHQQQQLQVYHAPGDDTLTQSPSIVANLVIEQQPSVLTFCTSGDVDSFQYPSSPLNFNIQQLHPMPQFGTSEDETTTTAQRTSTLPKSDQEILSPPSSTPANNNSVQDSSTCFQCFPGQESPPPPLPSELDEINSFGDNGDLDVLLNASGSPSYIPELFWDTDIDDMLYKINHTSSG